MDVEYVMTTFVDDGLVDISDGPDSPFPIDESKIIDLDDINAAIEDPGYILDEEDDPPENTEESEKFTSSYGKRSFILPVSFFDISSNIRLLTQCRPISIRIVDCELHPWYYEKYRRTNNDIENLNDIKDEQQKQQDLAFDAQKIEDVLVLKQGELKTETFTTSQSNISGIELSPEQRLAVFRLKEKIKSDIEKSLAYTDDTNRSDRALTINNQEQKMEDPFSNNVPQRDLLAYCKAIAQTIVHNTDHGEVKLKPKMNAVEGIHEVIKTNLFNSDIQSAEESSNMHDTVIPQKNKSEIEKASEKIVTSPILPCTIKQKKKTESKRNIIKNSAVENPHSENWSDLKNSCNRLTSSVHRVIPHYHNLPLHLRPTASNDYQFQYMDANQMMLHYYSIQRSEMINKLPQHTMSEMRCLTTNKDQTSNPHNMFIPSANYVRGLPPMHVEPKSCYHNFSTTFAQNLPLMSSICQQINRKAVQPINPSQNTNVLAPHYSYANALSLNSCSPQSIKNSTNKNDIITETNFGNLYNCMNYEHDVLNYNNSTVVPSQQNQSLVGSDNPLLSQMLNQSLKPQGHLHINQQNTDRNKLLCSNDIQRASSVVRNENINVHQYFNPTFVTTSTKEPPIPIPIPIAGKAFRKEKSEPRTKNKTITIIARKKSKPKDTSVKNNVKLSIRSNTTSTIDGQSEMKAYEILNVDKYSADPHRINNHDQIMYARPLTQNVELSNNNNSTALQPSVVNFETSLEVPSTANCYSPAILPIPTFKRSLEMLQKIPDPKIVSNTNGNQISRKNHKVNLGRKRKHNDNNDVRVKKISLQEYKQRIESCKANAKPVTDIVIDNNVKIEDNKAVYNGMANVDTLMDLGYDSDTTVIIDTTN